MRRVSILLLTLLMLALSAWTAEAASSSASIDVAGAANIRNCDCSQDLYDCSDFASQDDAQACYWTCGAQNRGDVHKLDLDVNMVACDLPVTQSPTRPNPPPPPTRPAPTTSLNLRSCDCSQDLYDCSDFASQDDAQACYWNCGAQNRGDVHKLDVDVNRVACDVLAIDMGTSSVGSAGIGNTDSDIDHGHEHDVHEHEGDESHTHETHDNDQPPTAAEGININHFFDGALTETPTIQDCTLADGTETTCYEITIAGYPSNYDVGPFCPETIYDSAEMGGIWFDGNGLYDVDGAFILGLSTLYNDSNWRLYDDNGNVNVTDSPEAFDAAARPNVDPAYQNHCVEGRIEWLENGEPIPTTVLIPTTPVVGASVTQPRGGIGVTLNGVTIDNAAPVQAILGAYTIAAFDDCGGHINPVAGYHLHGARGCSELGKAVGDETPIFAYALDGYPIHSPLDPADEAAAMLDECQGHTTEAYGYHYHAASAEKNAILSCLKGVTVQNTAGGPGGGGPPGGGAPGGGPPGDGGPGGPPDFAAAAAQLGISEQALMDALGGPPPNFEGAAATLGITVEALQDALGQPPR